MASDIRETIKKLQTELREEMIRQNNRNSLVRSYAKADVIKEQISNYRDMLNPYKGKIRFDPNWRR